MVIELLFPFPFPIRVNLLKKNNVHCFSNGSTFDLFVTYIFTNWVHSPRQHSLYTISHVYDTTIELQIFTLVINGTFFFVIDSIDISSNNMIHNLIDIDKISLLHWRGSQQWEIVLWAYWQNKFRVFFRKVQFAFNSY